MKQFFYILSNPFYFVLTLYSLGFKPGISTQRIIALFITSEISCKGFLNRKTRFNITCIAAIPFMIDYHLDERDLLLRDSNKATDIHRSIAQSIHPRLLWVNKGELSKLQKQEIKLIKSDILAQRASTFKTYIQHSADSVGLKLITSVLFSDKKNRQATALLNISTKIIRVLSDKATQEKDHQENRLSTFSFVDMNYANNYLYSLRKRLKESRIESSLERFIYNVTRLSFIFYSDSDFKY